MSFLVQYAFTNPMNFAWTMGNVPITGYFQGYPIGSTTVNANLPLGAQVASPVAALASVTTCRCCLPS